MIFKTPIIHANISEKDGYICLTALNNWNPERDNLSDSIVKPIMDILANPSFDDAIHPESKVPFKNYDKIYEKVKEFATIEYTDEQFEKIEKRINDEKASK